MRKIKLLFFVVFIEFKQGKILFLCCSGIGIVNAIEVVNAFPEEDGLQKFREWLESPDPSILGKLNAHAGHNARKRKLKACSNDADGLTNNVDGESAESVVRGHDEQQSVDGLPDIKQIFMDKHVNYTSWHCELASIMN